MRTAAALAFALFGAASAGASELYTVTRVDAAAEDLRVFWRDDAGVPFRGFDRLSAWLGTQGQALVFAMNAGMYEADSSAVGLLVIAGKELSPLNLADGPGNFYLKPNGVFLIGRDGAKVVDALDYGAAAPGVRYATQSGPMLLEAGRISPAFKPESTSRRVRNGVCVADGRVLFAISNAPVNFHEFAVFFRDELHCRDALYLDGVVSGMYSAQPPRDDVGAPLGPIFGVVKAQR